jgi:hypothetical protein
MSNVVLEGCDPREREADLKDLFARNGKEIFAEVFDRSYRQRAAEGLRSWVGLVDGRVVMHISVTPLRFTGGGRTMVGGVLSDLMVDDAHRDFWAPVRMLRKMLGDIKRNGEIDFLLTTTTSEAESVFKAGGFKPFGTLRRYVLPLNPLYLAATRLRARVKRTRAASSAFEECRPQVETWASHALRPAASSQFYRSRIPRFEFVDGQWITVANGRSGDPGYAMLARDPQHDELRLADAFWHDQGIRLGEVVHAAARRGRALKFKKLTLDTIGESNVAADLQRLGFFPREARSVMLLHQVSQNAAPHANDWFLLGFALSGW